MRIGTGGTATAAGYRGAAVGNLVRVVSAAGVAVSTAAAGNRGTAAGLVRIASWHKIAARSTMRIGTGGASNIIGIVVVLGIEASVTAVVVGRRTIVN
jgi:hypothetical protein